MADIDVAVIIVSYKSAELAIDCLRSIDAQRGTPGLNIRCIVVDNASGDTPVIERAIEQEGWNWATLITAERNGGFAYGNNLGIRRAYADGAPPRYVHLLNPDTVLLPGAIEALVQFLESRPDAGIAGGSFDNADGSEWAIAFRFPTLVAEVVEGLGLGLVARLFSRWKVAMPMGREVQAVDWVAGASMMVRREVLDSIGGMDEAFFLYYEETEFCFRAKAAGFSVWYVPQSRVIHIAGQSTKVTERNALPRRLPGYWFASRRRYFAITRGIVYAVAVDLAALLAHSLGTLKRILQGRSSTAVPHFLRDLLSESLIWPRNRRAARSPPGVPHF